MGKSQLFPPGLPHESPSMLAGYLSHVLFDHFHMGGTDPQPVQGAHRGSGFPSTWLLRCG